MTSAEYLLRTLFNHIVEIAQAKHCLPDCLPKIQNRVWVMGAGKAAAAMAKALEQHYGDDIEIQGLVVTRYGHGVSTEKIKVVEASHPVPDHQGQAAAEEILNIGQSLTSEDTAICLLSGGGSALLSLPAQGISAEQKRKITKQLLDSGADIDEINCLRRHLSKIKGGRLAAACYPATLYTFAISDVVGNNPSVIASGPTVEDTSSPEQALNILNKYQIKCPKTVLEVIRHPDNAPPSGKQFDHSQYHLIQSPEQAFAELINAHAELQLQLLGTGLQGEARNIAREHASLAIEQQLQLQQELILVSGGELTVTIKGQGKGGPNTEYLLALAIALNGQANIYAIACDTDGIDGSEDNAGAVIGPDTLARGRQLGLNAEAYLANNDAYAYFKALGDLVITGPTLTNVNDFRGIYIEPL